MCELHTEGKPEQKEIGYDKTRFAPRTGWIRVMSVQKGARAAFTALLINALINLLALPVAAKPATLDPLAHHEHADAAQVPGDTPFVNNATGDWSGAHQRLREQGVTLNAQLVLEGFHNFLGGLKTGTEGALTFDLNLALDTGKAVHWHGGTLYVDLEDHAGQNPSTVLTGDLQTFDKLNSTPYLQIFELWYQQTLFDGWLRLKLGKVDANTEFSVIDNGLPFLNASTQVAPTIIVFPTTPDPMPGANLFFAPANWWYASFGAFYANRSDTFGDFFGHPQNVQLTDFGTFLIGETGIRWHHAPGSAAGGNLKLGAWGHTGTFNRLGGGRQRGTDGYYAVLDQTLWQPSPGQGHNRGIRIFFESGHAQPDVSIIDWNVTGGITWTGMVAARQHDILGFSANYAHLSVQAGLPYTYELALEGLYRFRLLPWMTLLPDLQYILHPGGFYPNAVIGTLDVTVQF